jgi:membrane protease YdiL (CAAX protease family)
MKARASTAVVLYLGLSLAWIVLHDLPKWLGLGGELQFWLGRVANPVLMTAVVLGLARHWGPPARLLSFRKPAPRFIVLAAIAGLPSVLFTVWCGATQSFAPLLTAEAGRLIARMVLNQAWLEELLARGLLLGVLLAAGLGARRVVVLGGTAFGLMHLIQFLMPPITVEGLLNGLVLVALTGLMGIAWAWLTLRSGSIWPAVLLHFLTDLQVLPQKLLVLDPALEVPSILLPILVCSALALALWKIPALRAGSAQASELPDHDAQPAG